MKKDITILNLVIKLKLTFDFTLLEVVDYWESDLCAIGLMKGNKLVYISTFNYAESEELMYDFDLEIIDVNDKEKISVLQVYRNVSEDDLMSEIKNFLEV